MTLTSKQMAETIALRLYEACTAGPVPTTLDEAMEQIRAQNAEDGLTVESSGSLGSVVRHEGVRLSDAMLQRGYELGRTWLREAGE